MGESKTNLTRLLDEIERLRGIVCREHDTACMVVRDGTFCSCGAQNRALGHMVEVQALRAQLVQARITIECDKREIVRLDRRVLELVEYVNIAECANVVESATGPLARGSAPEISTGDRRVLIAMARAS